MYYDSKIATVEQYLRKLSGQEKELGIACDHNYVKPWHAHVDCQRTKPAKMLFMSAIQKLKSTYVCPDEEIDVVNVAASENPPPPFDSQKTKVLANELERSLKCNLNSDTDGSELEDFPIESCSPQKRKIFKEVWELINADILAKVVYGGQPHEFIKRKITAERCARQLRIIYANTLYDFDILLWIHKLILDKGNVLTVSSYLNILQILSTKIPSIVDKILKSYSGSLGYEYLCQILKKQWDPIVPVLNQHKPKKLAGNPFLLMNCAGFNISKAMDKSSRFNFWMTHLNALCKTMYIPMDRDGCSNTFEEALDDVILELTKKITESKNHFPKRPVILSGWTIGALIACHVALDTAVDAVVCFGFPLTGVNGSRGDLNDPLLDSKVPTLFIIGQNSNMCSTDDIEDFRSRMRAESGLVIVGGADDLLRISPQKMLSEGITQEIVDRCILDEISEFLHSIVKVSTACSMAASSSAMGYLEETDEDHYHKESRKRKRRQGYLPELPSPRKSSKNSGSHKEIANVPLKHRISPFSSETSSSGTHKNEKQNLKKGAKQNPEKRGVGRPPIGSIKIKIPKPVAQRLAEVSTKSDGTFKNRVTFNVFPREDSPPPEKPSKKSALPFALNILPKKNAPVDVEKAFGNDSSFLPRPLTPPDFDAISTEGIQQEVTGLESNCPVVELLDSDFANHVPDVNSSSGVMLTPFSEKPSITILDSSTASGSVLKPTLNLADSKKGVSVFVAPSGIKTVFQDGKVLTSKSETHLNISSGKLPASSFGQVSSNATKTMITVPTNTGTVLVSGQALKTPSGKILQLLSKGPVSLKLKDAVTPELAGSSCASESIAQSGNKFFLSSSAPNVTELSKNIPKKIEANSSATLVKLAVPDKPQNLKQMQILKGFQSRSAPTRIETPEEMAEKRLAIQALSNSLNPEAVTATNLINRESGYSICYAKPDGSIMSRAVPRPSDHSTYIRHSIIARPSGRGKMQPILPNKSYRFYHK